MKNLIKIISLSSIILLSPINSYSKLNNPVNVTITKKSDVSFLIHYFSNKGFEIRKIFLDSRFEVYKNIKSKFEKSPEKKIRTIEEYKKIIGFKEKSKELPKFIKQNYKILKESEENYNVPKELTASIIGIESDYGKNKGKYNPFNVYVSMFLENYKKDFAIEQLEELLKFSEKKNLDVLSLSSSYAGAISHAQFIPSSLNKWFVGRELYNMKDNILSVANYISYFNKKTGSLEKAVFNYNKSDFYVETVMDLYESAIKKEIIK